MEEETSDIERLITEKKKFLEENEMLKARVKEMSGWNPPPFNPFKDPDFFKTHGYAGGGAFPLKKKVD